MRVFSLTSQSQALFRHTDRKVDDSTQASHASELLCRLWFLFAEFQGHRIETSWGIPHFTQSNYSQFSLIIFGGVTSDYLQYPLYIGTPFLGQWENRDAPFWWIIFHNS